MDISKLRVLLSAADNGSLSKAADLLGYTQSGVTHMMNTLEEEAGFPLLTRGNRGVKLSADGERLAPLMRELLACNERLEQEMALTRGMEQGHISIGAYASVSLHWLPGALERFQMNYPGIDVELLEGNGTELEDWLSEGRIDLAFTSLQPHFRFDTIELAEDPLFAVLPKNHPMANADVFPVKRFEGEPFLAYTTATHLDVDLSRAMRQANISPKARFSSNYDYTVIAMVEHNLGVTIMSELILRGRDSGVACVPLDPPISRHLGIAMRSRASASPAMRRFIDCAMESIKY